MEEDRKLGYNYMMFENETNICWLDACVALIAFNRTFKKIVECCPESKINRIISFYDNAVKLFNSSNSTEEQRKKKTQEMLLSIQKSTLMYLKKFLKNKHGEPDSAFCALLCLIYRDRSNIKEHLNVSWIWKKHCSMCDKKSKTFTCSKPVITLSKVNTFQPECPSSFYTCVCKSEQEMKLIYKELPACLIFHFEKGAGTGNKFPINFSIKGREYHLTTIIVLEKSSEPNLNHFVTFIRQPFSNMWLECNDLNSELASYSKVKPEFDLKDVYISVFEAFDNLDKITNDEILIDQEHDLENSNVEIVNLSDDDDYHKDVESYYKTKASKSSLATKNGESSKLLKHNDSEVDVSKKELLTDNKEDNISNSVQNFKKCFEEEPVEGKKYNINSENASLNSRKYPIKISLNTYETEKSKNCSYKDIEDKELGAKEIDCDYKDLEDKEFGAKEINCHFKDVEKKEFGAKETDSSEHKFTENTEEKFPNFKKENEISSVKDSEDKSEHVDCQTKIMNKDMESNPPFNKKISVIKKLKPCDSKKFGKDEKACNISNYNTSMNNHPSYIKSSPKQHETKPVNLESQDKAVNESKEAKITTIYYPKPKLTNDLISTKKEIFPSSTDSDTTANGTVTDNNIQKDTENNFPHIISVSKSTLHANQKELDNNHKNELKIRNESKFEMKRERADDEHIEHTRSIKKIKVATTSVAKGQTTDNANTMHKEPSTEKKSHIYSVLKSPSYAKQNEFSKYENKLQIKNKSEFEVKKERADDENTTSTKNKKEVTGTSAANGRTTNNANTTHKEPSTEKKSHISVLKSTSSAKQNEFPKYGNKLQITNKSEFEVKKEKADDENTTSTKSRKEVTGTNVANGRTTDNANTIHKEPSTEKKSHISVLKSTSYAKQNEFPKYENKLQITNKSEFEVKKERADGENTTSTKTRKEGTGTTANGPITDITMCKELSTKKKFLNNQVSKSIIHTKENGLHKYGNKLQNRNERKFEIKRQRAVDEHTGFIKEIKEGRRDIYADSIKKAKMNDEAIRASLIMEESIKATLKERRDYNKEVDFVVERTFLSVFGKMIGIQEKTLQILRNKTLS